jgi:hypothetical protein
MSPALTKWARGTYGRVRRTGPTTTLTGWNGHKEEGSNDGSGGSRQKLGDPVGKIRKIDRKGVPHGKRRQWARGELSVGYWTRVQPRPDLPDCPVRVTRSIGTPPADPDRYVSVLAVSRG